MSIDTKALREMALWSAEQDTPTVGEDLVILLLDEVDRLRAAIATSQLVKDHDDAVAELARIQPVYVAAREYRAWAERVGLLTANCPADVAVELCAAVDDAEQGSQP